MANWRNRKGTEIKFNLIFYRSWAVWMNSRLHTIRHLLIQMCRLRVFFWLFYCIWRTSYVWSPWEEAFQ